MTQSRSLTRRLSTPQEPRRRNQLLAGGAAGPELGLAAASELGLAAVSELLGSELLGSAQASGVLLLAWDCTLGRGVSLW